MRGRKFRIKWFRLLILVVVGYSIYICAGQQLELRAVQREAEVTRTRLEQARQANEALSGEKNALNTPASVEKLAREELGLVKPGEVPYIPTGKK